MSTRPWLEWRDNPAFAAIFAADPDDLAWQDKALCAEVDGELFFPEKGGSTREAKAICRRCPVIDDCLEYSMEHSEKWGIWGGLSERERRRLRRDREAEAA
jgi:WhiB family redox-sensing transcriptional regulator